MTLAQQEPCNCIETLKTEEILTTSNWVLALWPKVNCHVLSRTPEGKTSSHPNPKSEAKPVPYSDPDRPWIRLHTAYPLSTQKVTRQGAGCSAGILSASCPPRWAGRAGGAAQPLRAPVSVRKAPRPERQDQNLPPSTAGAAGWKRPPGELGK